MFLKAILGCLALIWEIDVCTSVPPKDFSTVEIEHIVVKVLVSQTKSDIPQYNNLTYVLFSFDEHEYTPLAKRISLAEKAIKELEVCGWIDIREDQAAKLLSYFTNLDLRDDTLLLPLDC